MSVTAPVFGLPDRLAAKRDPALIEADERHFERIAAELDRAAADVARQLAAARTRRAAPGGEAVERDAEIRRLAARLRMLGAYRLDLCLGRMVPADGGAPVYIGRTGLTDRDGRRLLVDWRSPAAAPFFGATLADPMGLASRRRYRWADGRITDYWDEALNEHALMEEVGSGGAAFDDQSAFLASLGETRTERMRDVLGTLQADQDAIIRADSAGALVVDGGPGTGKTVVALHRSAYLVYADPRLATHHGGVLVVGPSPAYLAYVADVLPSLGEEGIRMCTLRDLVPEGVSARAEPDPRRAELAGSAMLCGVVERAVRYHEQPPSEPTRIATDWTDVVLTPEDWADAFDVADGGIPHNEARDDVWDALIELIARRLGVPPRQAGRVLQDDADLRRAFAAAWPLLDPAGVVADLLSVPAYLRWCAPGLTDEQVAMLQRDAPRAWTAADLPLLDAARALIGDPAAGRRRRAQAAAAAVERARITRVADELLASGDDLGGIWMLSQEDVREQLVDHDAGAADHDPLAGPFAHIVVDEAQELTSAEWGMLLRRCPSRSFTVVGDRAQARNGFAEGWAERLERAGLDRVRVASLTVNYRTPQEVMAEAEPVIRAALPDANVPVSIRSSGVPVLHASVAERDAILGRWLAEHDDGVACVIGDPTFAARPRVQSLTPAGAKGLEFDLVVVVDSDGFGGGITGAVDRYVAMTRATRQLVILSGQLSG